MRASSFDRVHWLQASESTNSDLRDLWQAGAEDRTVVITDNQTLGRGRQGRGWQTPQGEALAVSVLLRDAASLKAPLGLLSLLAGSAVAATFNEFLPAGVTARVKWPNDVLAVREGESLGKLSGILSELLPDGSVICGMGLNLLTSGESAPGSASLRSLGALVADQRSFDDLARTFATDLLTGFFALIDEAKSAVDPIFERIVADSFTIGQQVRAQMPSGDVVGLAAAISPDGSLTIETAEARHVTVTAADVWHLRPKDARQ